uniref:DUF1995 domain-containing protein n=1 Tax=Aegilops tauschii subsp. strangulata TaxID=200361 RepID=A0A453QN51_AEGTS
PTPGNAAALLWVVARLTDRVRCFSLSLWLQLPAAGSGGRDMAVGEGQRRFRQLRRHARNRRAADPSAGVPQPGRSAGRGLGAVENTPRHARGGDWPEVVKAVFPDAGVAALLKHQWKDAKFKCASLSDRKPVDTDDGVVVMIIPDHQMLESVERIASQLADDPIRPLVMWNPRLVSGDVGVGYNVRNLRRNFLSTFTTVYSMRPLPTGAIFRCYPEKWKVFYDDPKRPNRYLLARESSSRPDATDIEIIFGGGGASEQPEEEPSMMTNVMAAFSSVSRFMRVISK